MRTRLTLSGDHLRRPQPDLERSVQSSPSSHISSHLSPLPSPLIPRSSTPSLPLSPLSYVRISRIACASCVRWLALLSGSWRRSSCPPSLRATRAGTTPLLLCFVRVCVERACMSLCWKGIRACVFALLSTFCHTSRRGDDGENAPAHSPILDACPSFLAAAEVRPSAGCTLLCLFPKASSKSFAAVALLCV